MAMGRRTKKDIKRVLKDLKSKRGARTSRKNPTPVLAQTALAVPRKAFGTRIARNNRNPGFNRTRALMGMMDARVPRTIGLPRAVGPYTVIRVSRLISSSARVIVFGSFMADITTAGEQRRWLDWDAIEDVDADQAINGPNNATYHASPLGSLGDTAEVVPASLTVQVMNPNSLQNAKGIFAMARVNQQLDFQGYSESWNNFAGQFLSYYNPRLLSGGKLSIRGVVCNSYPLDMNEYSHFCRVRPSASPNGTVGLDKFYRAAALAPITFVQQNVEAQDIEFLVTKEYRVRFDPGNPATASHVHHDVTSDSDWSAMIKTMTACGHGVSELAEDAADLGVMGAAARIAVAAL